MSAFSPAGMTKSTNALGEHFVTLHEIGMHPTKRIPGRIKACTKFLLHRKIGCGSVLQKCKNNPHIFKSYHSNWNTAEKSPSQRTIRWCLIAQ